MSEVIYLAKDAIKYLEAGDTISVKSVLEEIIKVCKQCEKDHIAEIKEIMAEAKEAVAIEADEAEYWRTKYYQ